MMIVIILMINDIYTDAIVVKSALTTAWSRLEYTEALLN